MKDKDPLKDEIEVKIYRLITHQISLCHDITILKHFYDVRLVYYHKRKAYLLKKLKRELNIIKYKVIFIEAIIDEKIVIFRKKKDEVSKILKNEKYPIFDMSADILKDNCDKDGNYNYLTSMPIYTFTEEKINELKTQEENKKAEVEEIESKSETDMWRCDIDEFEKEYKKWMKKFEQSIKDEKNAKVNVSTKNKGKNKNRSKGKK